VGRLEEKVKQRLLLFGCYDVLGLEVDLVEILEILDDPVNHSLVNRLKQTSKVKIKQS
jgi:hypothetical protein